MKLFLILMLICNTTYADVQRIKKIVDNACDRYGATDCTLVHAIIYAETNYNLSRLKILDSNKEYSYGLMMVQCETARLVGLNYDCEQLEKDLLVGLRFGILYLEQQLSRYNGDILMAISAYNMGTAVVCQQYNPNHCYPGEVYNYEYTNKVIRRYRWLKNEKQKQTTIFYNVYKNVGGSATYLTNSKWVFQTILGATEDSPLVSNLKLSDLSP